MNQQKHTSDLDLGRTLLDRAIGNLQMVSSVLQCASIEAEARPDDDEPVNLRETDADMAARFAGQIGELTSRIEDALSWFHEPDDATPEIQLAKIRAALTGESRRG